MPAWIVKVAVCSPRAESTHDTGPGPGYLVDDIANTVARLRPHGGELVGEIARFEDSCLLCRLRGPEGVIVGLAGQLG